MTTTTQKVIKYLTNRKTGANANTITTRTGVNYNTLRRILGELIFSKKAFKSYDKNGYTTYSIR